VVCIVKFLHDMVTLCILVCVVKERQVVFILSKEMGRYCKGVEWSKDMMSYKLDEHPTKHEVFGKQSGIFGKKESYCRDILKKECMILMPCYPLRRWCLNPSLASEIWVEHRLHLAPGRSPCAPAQYMGDVACCCLCMSGRK
jgi:hypothetical protein